MEFLFVILSSWVTSDFFQPCTYKYELVLRAVVSVLVSYGTDEGQRFDLSILFPVYTSKGKHVKEYFLAQCLHPSPAGRFYCTETCLSGFSAKQLCREERHFLLPGNIA